MPPRHLQCTEGALSEIPSGLQVVNCDSFTRPLGRTRRCGNHGELEDRKDALAACWRGASKEGGMPVSDNRADFKQLRRWGSDPDQDNRRCNHHEGCHRAHHDAQRATVGIARGRMCIRCMD